MAVVRGSATIYEDQAVTNQGQFVVPGNRLGTAQDSAGVDLKIFETTVKNPLFSATYAASALILPTPQPWDEDETGYNFTHTIFPQTFEMEGGKTYSWEYRIRSDQWGNSFLITDIKVKAVRGW